MKSFRLTVAALAAATLTVTASAASSVFAQAETETAIPATPEAIEAVPNSTSEPAIEADAATFGSIETDQAPYILVAQPTSRLGGRQRYGLMIIEQKKTEPLCFSTTGSNPTQVDILLLNFDFSGICGKSTDTNGYAVRVAGQDIPFDPVIENKDGILVLYGIPRRSAGQNARPFIIGQTDGIAANGFTQITMQPGWRLTRRTFQDRPTGLTYLTNDSTIAQLVEQSGGEVINEPPTNQPPVVVTPPTTPVVPPPSTPAPASFPDVAGDTYASEINRAVQLGFIKGFAEDNTFRPAAQLTREQLVSIVIEGLNVPDRDPVLGQFYPDVPPSRWSATKIEQARDLNIISGYQDGTFKPTQPVTRAELIAIMRRAAEYKNANVQVDSIGSPRTFSDTQGHWAQEVITNLSGYCGIATPLNESGSSFAPNTPAQRNYAAAAMVRLIDCSNAASAQ
ncbi:MAG: DUF3747 domain-containing protein [Cyanobacteria bacterium P01_F01_bin.53]